MRMLGPPGIWGAQGPQAQGDALFPLMSLGCVQGLALTPCCFPWLTGWGCGTF